MLRIALSCGVQTTMRTNLPTIVLFSLLSTAILGCDDHTRQGNTDDAQEVGSGDMTFPTPDLSDLGRVTDLVADEGRQDSDVFEADHAEDAVRADTPNRDLPPADTSTEDTPSPSDLEEVSEVVDCVLQWEECLVPYPGCWMSECPELTECSVAGCGSDVPDIDHLIHGGDFCGNTWVTLGDASGRVEARDIVRDSPYGEFSFTTHLDGEPATICQVHGLPTGAIRYEMTCDDLDGEPVHAAVLEQGPCPDCPSVEGCYAIEADSVICGFMPCPDQAEQVQILASGSTGCRLTMRFDTTSIPTFGGWVSYEGVVTLGYNQYGTDSVTCTFSNSGESLGPALCRMGNGEDAETMAIDIFLTPTGEELCDLPECVFDESCQRANLGESCVDGECRE